VNVREDSSYIPANPLPKPHQEKKKIIKRVRFQDDSPEKTEDEMSEPSLEIMQVGKKRNRPLQLEDEEKPLRPLDYYEMTKRPRTEEQLISDIQKTQEEDAAFRE